jgi:hypothetical protein
MEQENWLSLEEMSLVAKQLEAARHAKRSTLGDSPSKFDVTACHEASHAVAAVTLEISVEYVEMDCCQLSRRKGDIVGGLHLTPEFNALLLTGNPPDAADRDKLEKLAIVAIAGEAGQAVLEGRECDIRTESAEGDYEMVERIARKLYDDLADRDAFIKRQTDAANKLVNHPLHSSQIESVARHMKIMRDLSYDNVVGRMQIAIRRIAEEEAGSEVEE